MTENTSTATQPPAADNDDAPLLARNPVLAWIWTNLFSTPLNIALTLISVWFIWTVGSAFLEWALFNGVLFAESREACREISEHGACWAVVSSRINSFLYGLYTPSERWRINICFILLAAALVPVLWDTMPHRKRALLYSTIVFPILAVWLLVGGLGLEPVSTKKFSGFMLTLVIGVTGISLSLPIGILLALARRSSLPVLRILSIVFIEFIRGVPLITLLFIASVLLSYFLPPGASFDLIIRVLIMVTLFASAYMAEVVRGGFQSIPNGQYEAAQALGLGYWRTLQKVILPQVLKVSIPGIVNSFIGLYKDTTLVIIIGLFDPLGIGRSLLSDAKWAGLSAEVYLFVALFYFVSCFSMSRYSLYVERKLEREQSHDQ
ncbi:MAG: amino acid ABC transporter permease [Alphaproteobacteria bacterium]